MRVVSLEQRESFKAGSSARFRGLMLSSIHEQDTSNYTAQTGRSLAPQSMRRLTDDGEFEDDLEALGYPFV